MYSSCLQSHSGIKPPIAAKTNSMFRWSKAKQITSSSPMTHPFIFILCLAVLLGIPFKRYCFMHFKLPLRSRIHWSPLRTWHWLLLWASVFRTRCLSGPTAQLHLSLHAGIWGKVLWTWDRWMQKCTLCQQCHLHWSGGRIPMPVCSRI